MELRVERIALETDRHRITGELHLPREGYRSRLSDYLNRGDDQFIPLANAEIRPLGDGAGSEAAEVHDFLAVARNHVTLAYHADE